MKFPVAERFKAPQGEGLYSGQQMAFIRLVGCSVGKGICHACDTDFDRILPALGGGMYTVEELKEWAKPCEHVCLTGGEPLDRDLRPLIFGLTDGPVMVHVETSGTVKPEWLDQDAQWHRPTSGKHTIALGDGSWRDMPLWVTVSPKPGYLPEMVESVADELKVILGGLGDGPGWPTVADAVRWEADGALVYIQPRNEIVTINGLAMSRALHVIDKHPQLRLSTQLHKFIRTR